MSGLVDTWNGLAEPWLSWLLARSVASALAFVVVCLAVLLARRRMSAHAPSHLLLLPALLLVVPVERALPNGVVGLAPSAGWSMAEGDAPSLADGERTTGRVPAPAGAEGSAAEVHAEVGEVAARTSAGTPSGTSLLLAAWTFGVGTYLFWLVRAHLRTGRHLRRLGRAPSAELRERFDRLCGERGFDGPVALHVVPGLPSPIATGIVRRAVWVPDGIDRLLSAPQLRFVLLHELEHHARRDVLAEGFLLVVRAAFCLHPVTWLTLALHRRWREFACDEAALARAGAQQRVPIADALVALIRLANAAPGPRGAITSLVTSNQVMKTRLARILDRTLAPRRSLSAAGLFVVATTGLGALTIASAQAPGNPGGQPPKALGENRQRPPKPDGEVAIAIDQGIAWLLAAQQADGSWDIGPDPRPDTPRDHNQVHVTGLALCAVLHGHKGPRHLEVVRAVERGDTYLRSTQNEQGLFGGGEPLAEAYGHAQVLRTLCAIQRVAPDDRRLECIARGIAYAEEVRNPYMGWRYRPRDGDNDSKHTSLMLLAFLDAGELGIAVPPRALECGRMLLDQLTDDTTGRTGFVTRGSPMSRFKAKAPRFPGVFSEEPTAMRILVEKAFADGAGDTKVMARAAAIVRDMPPRWAPDEGRTDFAYWCFGAGAMAAVGGEHAEVWRKALHETLLGARLVDGGRAHWPADDAWGRPGMEAYSTASAVLALHALH